MIHFDSVNIVETKAHEIVIHRLSEHNFVMHCGNRIYVQDKGDFIIIAFFQKIKSNLVLSSSIVTFSEFRWLS